MPSRLLREGILDSEGVNQLSHAAEVFYRRLMSVVDDFGRFDGRPSILRSRLYALRVETVREADIPRWIAECEKAGLIALYAVDGKPYVLFRKLGSPRAKESRYPAPPDALDTAPPASTQTFTDVNTREQTHASVPYSGSGSYSGADSDSDKTPPNPPQPGGTDGALFPTGEEPRKRKPKRPKQPRAEHPLFAEFWDAYPRKVKKDEAAQAFAKINPDAHLLAKMLAALAWQRTCHDWTKDGGSFVPHPPTWLNGSRWNDERPPQQQPAAGTNAPPMTAKDRERKEILDRYRAKNRTPEPTPCDPTTPPRTGTSSGPSDTANSPGPATTP